jgi:hypothetical protein
MAFRRYRRGTINGATDCIRINPFNLEDLVRKFLIPIAAGAAALLSTQAQASDMLSSTTQFYADEAPVVENVRMVCDEYGRCLREPRRKTVIIEDSYNYAPRERYIERRYRDDRSAPGVGIRAPGVSIGVGFGNDRW